MNPETVKVFIDKYIFAEKMYLIYLWWLDEFKLENNDENRNMFITITKEVINELTA